MKSALSQRLAPLALLLALVGMFSQQSAFADTVTVNPVPFHRFIVSNQNLGHFLSANFLEGQGYPYNYASQPFPYQAEILVCPSGYNPQAGQGLVALHRWQVDQRPRIYYYYSIYYSNLGSDYRYQGVAGYVKPAGSGPGTTPLNFWYSQYYGYYFTLDGEYPPGYSFTYHGVPFNLLQGGSYVCETPPDPCAGFEAERDYCWMNGGNWNNYNCTCSYPNECPPGMICDLQQPPPNAQ